MKVGTIVVTLLAFALGAGVGVWWAGGHPEGSADTLSPAVPVGHGSEEPSAVANPDNVVSVGGGTDEDSSPAVESTVEVIVDNSPAPEPEILTAHAARQARRRAAREQQAKEQRDFLSALNDELLTPAQRKVHALYVEASEVRDSLRKEISALRAAGEEVPAEMQARLAEAESVLRADRDAELRALREAAARAAGIDESAIRQLIEDLASIEAVLPR